MGNVFWKLTILFLILLLTTETFANNKDNSLTSTERVLYLKFGKALCTDAYLSPLRYTGFDVIMGSEWHKNFKKNPKFSHFGYIQIGYTDLANRYHNNKIYGISADAGWGSGYNWCFLNRKIDITIGPFLNFDYLGKLHAKNVNKPYSMDVGLDLGNTTSFSFKTFLNKKKGHTIRIKYDFFNNWLGLGYCPHYWQSYYEIMEGIKGKTTCSGLWNRLYLKHRLVFDFQVNKFKCRVGFEHNFLKYNYGTYDTTFQNFCIIVGYILNYKVLYEKFYND